MFQPTTVGHSSTGEMGRQVQSLLRFGVWNTGLGRRNWAAFSFVVGLLGLVLAAGTPTTAAANSKYASIVVDAHDGTVLFSRNADAFRYPASLTKMMTLYMVFERLDSGEMSLSDRITITSAAASQPPSKLGLRPGNKITVDQAIRALVTKSANDVAAAVGIHIAGSERAFGRMMTERAREMGMSKTTFRNASGLPDSNQRTTARDMAALGRALIHEFPDQYDYFSTTHFTWKGVTYRNHNRLLGKYKGTNGIKTGYTRASGFNLTTSVDRNGYKLIAVVMGGKTSKSRDKHMIQLLDNQFARLRRSPSLANRGPLIAMVPGPRAKPASVIAAAQPGNPDVLMAALSDGAADADDPIAKAIERLAESPTPAKSNAPVRTAGMSMVEPFLSGEGDTDDSELRVLEWLGHDQHWGIQIGAFAAMESAAARLSAASALAPEFLNEATPAILPSSKGKSVLYRARFGPFDATRAQAACAALTARGIQCVPVQDTEGPRPNG